MLKILSYAGTFMLGGFFGVLVVTFCVAAHSRDDD